MKPEFETSNSENLFRLRIDNHNHDILLKWFLKETIKNYLCTAELASVTQKEHMHVVFQSDKSITQLRTSFRKFTNYQGNYSFSQNWSKETKSSDMKTYMDLHDLTYKDIHIIYILKDSDIRLNTLIANAAELDFDEIKKTIGCKSKQNRKKYGNYTKKLIMEYNEQYPEPLIEVSCGSLDDYPEKERIFKFVTRQMSHTNLDIFLSNAKKFDDYTIKMLCQTLLNTRKYGDFYPESFRDDILKWYL